MLSNTLLLVVVFTTIDILTSTNNNVMQNAFSLMQKQVYDVSSAMLWGYFVAVAAIIGAVFGLLNHFMLKKWE